MPKFSARLPDKTGGYKVLQIYQRGEPVFVTGNYDVYARDLLRKYYKEMGISHKETKSQSGPMMPDITDTEDQRVAGMGSVFVVPNLKRANFDGLSIDYDLWLDETHLKQSKGLYPGWTFMLRGKNGVYVPV
ncbi:MAG: hypothetical protein HYT71_02330 [Candidatus Aenigmarchaeota archaeon]|nr:hypothetical protein [Candidatus Aenigmarchaeota archaeon]